MELEGLPEEIIARHLAIFLVFLGDLGATVGEHLLDRLFSFALFLGLLLVAVLGVLLLHLEGFVKENYRFYQQFGKYGNTARFSSKV